MSSANRVAATLNGKPKAEADPAPAPKYPFAVPDFRPLWVPDIIVLPWGYGIAVCDLTPDLAELFLASMVRNRNQVPALLQKYGRDLHRGAWRLNHQSMAFNRAGQFFDGQHRCVAVINTGDTMRTQVQFGVGDRDEMAVTDSGGPRSATQASYMLGLDYNQDDVATVRRFLLSNRPRAGTYLPFTHTEILEVAQRLDGHLKTLREWFSGSQVKGADRATLRATVLAAKLCGFDPRRLERFVEILTNKGESSDPGDSAATRLRLYVINNVNGRGGQAVENDLFARSSYALREFLAGRPIRAAKCVDANPFLVPEFDPESLFAGPAGEGE